MQSQTNSLQAGETLSSKNSTSFYHFGLDPRLARAVDDLGYTEPTPIQVMVIPHLLEGRDVIGQAQTGTGKTAAFALPLLSRLDAAQRDIQVLVLTPTRELAIQVAEAFGQFSAHLEGVRTLPIYGGADIRTQLSALKRGVQVVVGTPGRVMDHMRRESLDLSNLSALVLDEADEMLRMGFIDDVTWILEQAPVSCQKALFSATMPPAIRKIARKHLSEPAEMTVEDRTTTAETIEQRYWEVRGMHRLDALTRILEAEQRDGVLIFTRTRAGSAELAEKLEARGFAATALNGDMLQAKREKTVERFRRGHLEILVATDVAARGLDVDRISHVINYDMPNDAEAYTHRIGRTGRAGRSGQAILFLNPRDRRMLATIERATRQRIEPYVLPTPAQVVAKRIESFKLRLAETLATEELEFFHTVLKGFQAENNVDPLEIAAALATMVPGFLPGTPSGMAAQVREEEPREERFGRNRERSRRRETVEGFVREERPRRRSVETRLEEFAPDGKPRRQRKRAEAAEENSRDWLDAQMERFRVEVGFQHGVQPGNLVGAIANEAGLDSRYIGRIVINDDHSTVDLPKGMPREVLKHLQSVWVAGQQLQMRTTGESGGRPSGKGKGAPAAGPRRNRNAGRPANGSSYAPSRKPARATK
ncbi:MAG: DEAD/DEAH box helicase [Planctomycetota bacterium]